MKKQIHQDTPPAGNDPQRLFLCQCNKCNIVLIDENPQTDAPEYALKGNEKEMVFIEENCFWACPICKTDKHLQDNITIADYTLPAGNDLPEQLEIGEQDSHGTQLVNEGEGMGWIHRDDMAEEIVRRYNDFPALQERNRQLVEALRKIEFQSTYLSKGINEAGDRHISDIWEIADKALKALESSK